jgi:hypothetical protein
MPVDWISPIATATGARPTLKLGKPSWGFSCQADRYAAAVRQGAK